MIERVIPRFGRLVFDRDAIVRAALRAYVEAIVGWLPNCLSWTICEWASWRGNFRRGAICKHGGGGSAGDYDVVAWTEAGVVGLAWELGWGPIEQLGLSVDAVTGGPDDVRGALPGLPEELELALVLATSMLTVGSEHGERDAGVGFWLCGDRVEGTLFNHSDVCGADRLAMWGVLRGARLRRMCDKDKATVAVTAELDRTIYAPFHALIDAVTDRALRGPTELTTDELATIVPAPPDPKILLLAQHMLQEVGITWPGSPELPPETPRPDINPFTAEEYVGPPQLTQYFGPVVFNQTTIIRAALRAYVESILAPLDPLARHVLTACVLPKWTGDLQRGAFYNGDGCGDYDVIAWTEAGIVGLAYKRGAVPIDPLGAALPGLPSELLPALEMAAGLLDVGTQGEKLASIGFWLHGDHTGGTLFDDPTLPGARRLVAWGGLDRLVPWGTIDNTGKGRLPLLGDRKIAALAVMLARTTASPIHALLDAVVDRRLHGPTELSADELTTLFPTLPYPEGQHSAQRMLQKVGITWPGVPTIPEEPQTKYRFPFWASPNAPAALARAHPLGFLVFDKDAIIRAALRAYIEVTLGFLDPQERHKFKPASYSPTWTGDIKRGAFSLTTTVAWTEAGVVGLSYERGPGPTEWLPDDTVTRNPDDVRRAVPDLPSELVPAFEMAFDLFNQTHSPRMKVRPVGFWLCGDRIGGTLFDTPTAYGVWSLALWGRVGRGRLLPPYDSEYATTVTEETFGQVAPILAVVDAVVERRLRGPTELLPDEIAIVLPTPPRRPNDLPDAQRSLQKVGITWPGSHEIPEPSKFPAVLPAERLR